MKILKWILIILVAIITIFLIYSSAQANKAIVNESIEINKPASTIYKALINFKNWDKWSVWSKMDPNLKYEYSENRGELGSSFEWISQNPSIASGKQEIVELKENEYLKFKINYKASTDVKYAEFILVEKDGVTNVTWTYEGSETPFYMNFSNSFVEAILSQSYKNGLSNLKTFVESLEIEDENPMNLEIMEVELQDIISIKDSTTADQVSNKLIELYTELSIYLEIHENVKANGNELALYHLYSPEKVVLEAAIPYRGKAKNDGRVVVKQIPSGKVLKGIHYGSFESSEQLHEEIEKYMLQKNIKYNGPCWEVYKNKASKIVNDSIEIQVFYPIK